MNTTALILIGACAYLYWRSKQSAVPLTPATATGANGASALFGLLGSGTD